MSCGPSSVYAPRRPQALSTEQYYYVKNVMRAQKARYEAIADRHRAELRVTSHARSLARALNLTINAPRAVSCPQRYVSVEPLPIIDDSIHPGSPPVHAASEELYPEFSRPHSYNTRQWSTGRCCAPIDVPVEETGRSLMEDIELDSPSSDSSDESSHSSVFTSSSDSSSSSLMYAPSTESSLMTPASSPLMIRIKRKSTLNEDYYESAAKQPRYLRKSWVQPTRYA